MCRSTTTENGEFPIYAKDREGLKLKTFLLRFYISAASRKLPETLTLIYLPQAGGGSLEVDGAKIRAGAPAFVVMNRVRSGEAAFASVDQVRVANGSRFEAYIGVEKVVGGVFRQRRGGGGDWGVECRPANEIDSWKLGLVEAEISVAGEGSVYLREKVGFPKNMKRREKKRFCSKLEQIPEEGEVDCCCCCDEEWEMVEKFEDEKEDDGLKLEMEMEIEGVKWAVDMGIWAVCLGVGFLVSRASYKGLRRKIII